MEVDKSELNDSLNEEIEALEAILDETDELKIVPDADNDSLVFTVRIAPLTASDTSRQYVGLYLRIKVNKKKYPDDQGPTDVNVFQVRGLDESKIEALLVLLKERCEEFIGMQVLFTLIDDCKEYLTRNNFPTCPCSICLFHIIEEDSFVKTSW